VGELGGKEGVPELKHLIREGTDVEAAGELYRLGEKDAQECLLAGLKSKDYEVRSEAVWTLWELSADETAAQILPLLDDPESDVRRSAIRVLADMRCRESVPGLIRLLNDRQVSDDALEAIAALGSREAKEEALKRIKEGKATSRSGAIAAGRLGLVEALKDLEKLRSHSDPDVRLASCEAMGLLGGTEEAGRLVKSLGDENWRVVEGALRGLRHLGEKAAPPLLKLLEDGSARERQIAIEALGRIGSKSAIPSLIRHLEDSITAVRVASASELCRLGVGEGVSLLLEERADLTYLNALADPEAWKRLTDRIPRIHRPTTVHDGSWKSWFLIWGEERRIPVRWQAGAPGALPSILVGGEYHPGALLPASEVPEQLSQWTEDGRFSVILEPSGLKIVPYLEAHRYWSRWRALNRK
jgi:HEAT repeat protein